MLSVRRRCWIAIASWAVAAWFAAVFPVDAAGPAAQSAQTEFATRARQAMLMDADSGAVLFQHKADERMSPASMSKLMGLALAFKALKAGEARLDDKFLMSASAWRRGGAPSGTSAMMVPVNTRETLDNLLQGVIVQSGNDAAIAIAEALGGSEDGFARLMTDEARKLGMKSSTFKNATGLYNSEHLTTARDLAILARHIIREHPDHYPRFAQREFAYLKHKFLNRNPLLGAGLGIDGMKTGFIKEAGYGLVASAKQDNRRLILVINGLDRADERKSEAIRLLEWGFKSFAEFKLFNAGEVVGQVRVWGGSQMWVGLNGGDADISVLLPRYPANQKLKAEIIYKGPLKTPIKKGDRVGVLRVTSSTQSVNELPLYASEDVSGGSMIRRGLDTLFHMAFRWVL